MKKTVTAMLLAGIMSLTACGQTASAQPAVQEPQIPAASSELFAMDTYMTVTCYGQRAQEALDASLEEIRHLDEVLTVGSEDSLISQINAQGGGTLDDDTAAMVGRSLELYAQTDGAFDITVYPLMQLWGFTTGDFAVPSAQDLADTLALVGADRLTLNDHTVALGAGQGIDLGGIAKGYTSTRLMEIFAQYGLTSGVVSLGGNVQCYGTKPDGSLWRCAIQDPNNPNSTSQFMGVLSVRDTAVITSGPYQRYFTDDTTGRTYHHILDPATGCSVDNGLVSVSIITPDGTLADALSTACFVLGADRAQELWRQSEESFEMILMDDTDTVYVTQGIADAFTSDYKTVVLEK